MPSFSPETFVAGQELFRIVLNIRSCIPIGTFSLIGKAAKKAHLQGDPKKMLDSVLKLKSVLKVRFYFPACVLESEFRAWLIWPPKNAFSESQMSQKRQKRL